MKIADRILKHKQRQDFDYKFCKEGYKGIS